MFICLRFLIFFFSNYLTKFVCKNLTVTLYNFKRDIMAVLLHTVLALCTFINLLAEHLQYFLHLFDA